MTTEREMLDLLNKRYATYNGNGIRYTRAEHVKVCTGFDAPRTCDYMAMDLWNGGTDSTPPTPKLHGHEVKCSRADWLVELRDPTKAEAFSQYCDYWWLVVSDRTIVHDEELPTTWGLIVPYGKGLRIAKQAHKNTSPKPMGRPLQATFSRAVTKTALRLNYNEDAALRFIGTRMGLHPWPPA